MTEGTEGGGQEGKGMRTEGKQTRWRSVCVRVRTKERERVNTTTCMRVNDSVQVHANI